MANFNFNRIMLGGRLAADPDNRQTESGISVTKFTVAVNRPRPKDGSEAQTDFFNVTAWRSTADFVKKYFQKGSSIFVVGELRNRSWTDNEGNKRYATDIVASEVNFVDSKGELHAADGTYIPEAYTNPEQPQFEEIGKDDDLPF